MSKRHLSYERITCSKCGSNFNLIRGEGESVCPICGEGVPAKNGGENPIKEEVE